MLTTCQICGREIKANTGVIAHHGYQRPGWGWQTDSCPGARELPYEISRDAIPRVIEYLEGLIVTTETALAKLIADPPPVFVHEPHYNHRRYGERKEYTRPDDFSWEAVETERSARNKFREQFGYQVEVPPEIINREGYYRKASGAKHQLEMRLKGFPPEIARLRKRWEEWQSMRLTLGA